MRLFNAEAGGTLSILEKKFWSWWHVSYMKYLIIFVLLPLLGGVYDLTGVMHVQRVGTSMSYERI
jgi:D-alanyl-lipoteichoic acid acyltransferase DltB (MBOAT superfamily)